MSILVVASILALIYFGTHDVVEVLGLSFLIVSIYLFLVYMRRLSGDYFWMDG